MVFPGSRSRLVFLAAFLAVVGLLPTGAVFGQAAESAVGRTRTELSVSTIEGATRTRATFTAKVGSKAESADSTAAAAPTGSVSFMLADQSLGSAFLDAEGRATLTVDALPAGTQNIVAVYGGDDSHLPSSSTPQAVRAVASGVPGFTLSANPTSLKVAVGSTATTVVTATPENGFNQAVSLSCSGVPYVSITCVFSPAQVTPGPQTAAAPNGTPVVSTLSIQTIAPSGAQLREPGRKHGMETAYAVALPGILALAGLGLARERAFGVSRRGAARLLGLAFLLLAGSLGLGGCNTLYNYKHKGPGYNPGTPVGNYTVVISGITGTGSSLSTGTVSVALDVTAN